ncbi:DNA internalization-related competence protein ComEC/Rec2 [Mycoplasmatota bacterium WC30]
MKTLKNLLQSDASKFIHVGVIVFLYILSYRYYIAIILLLIELVYIFRKSKNIIIYSLIFIVIITIKMSSLNQKDLSENFPITGEIQEANDNYFYLKGDKKYLCYYEQSNELEPGMIVEIEGYFSNTKTYNIMHTFDYETYLRSESISNVISVADLRVRGSTFNIYIVKHKIIEYLDNNFNTKTASYLKLFILGENDSSNSIDSKEINDLGISHIFAISGMHLGLLVGFLVFLLKKLFISKEKNRVIIVIFLILYNVITGFKISIIRASLLVACIYLKDYLNILLTKTDLLTFSFIFLLIINPYYIYALGFQLSYLIAFSIILGEYIFKDSDNIQRLIKTAIFANLVSMPITLEISNSFGLIFVLANLFFILYVSYLFLPLSLIVSIFRFLKPLYEIAIKIFELGVETFSQINLIVNFNFPNSLYKCIFWLLLFLMITNLKNLKRQIILIFAMLVIVLGSLFIGFKSIRFVRFLDVFQGDAIHIHDKSCNMLIDTGKTDKYDNLISYFKGYNINKIDIILITHFHEDHYGELRDIVDKIDVGVIYLNNANDELRFDYQVLKTGSCFTCGESKFQVISSNTNSSNENNNSLVLYGVIGEDRYLFTGDIETEIELQLINNYDFEVDILKVAHHGSGTSSTYGFLDKINSSIAIISVGENNYYNLPNKEVINRLEQFDNQIYRTDIDGTITIYYYDFLNLRLIENYQKQKRLRYIFSNI